MEHIPRGEAREKEGTQKRAVPPKRDWQRGRSSEGVLGPPNGVLKKTLLAGCSKTLSYKAPGSGDPPEGWGLQAKRGLIPRTESYTPVRRNNEG